MYLSLCIFEVEVEATECLEPNVSHQITFQAEGYSNDKTFVNIATNCDCDCENQVSKNICSTCNNRGKFNCGICECDRGWSGKCCDCDLDSRDQGNQLIDKCKRLEIVRKILFMKAVHEIFS